ncbi:substrate-binding domain-containing protein [Aegicerativicinus sediminis]
MKKITIGGVPEHFNYPWYLTLKNKEYHKFDINLRWIDYPEGTGAMCQALRNRDIDMAVILTEGIIKDIVDGNPSKIIQKFVGSPLNWGIHVASQSNYHKISDLKGTKAAISRFGSGSHLMAYVNAENHNWNLTEDLKFEVVNNIEGAVDTLKSGYADYFMWETFMTKPLVDQGIFRKIGNCPTPWPCFVIAATVKFLKDNKEEVGAILDTVNTYTTGFKLLDGIDQTISNRYGIKLEDVQAWLESTHWSREQLSDYKVSQIQETLLQLGIIDKILPSNQILV